MSGTQSFKVFGQRADAASGKKNLIKAAVAGGFIVETKRLNNCNIFFQITISRCLSLFIE